MKRTTKRRDHFRGRPALAIAQSNYKKRIDRRGKVIWIHRGVDWKTYKGYQNYMKRRAAGKAA
jgi:hypothetical protein